MAVPESNASPPVAAGQLLQERYRLIRPIARGGMAEVWEGHDVVLDRPVAIKLLHPALSVDEEFRERFRREAVAAARLSHPHVVATFDTGDDGPISFIVMELVPGRTLRDLLTEGAPLPAPLAVSIAVQAADALVHAHEAGLVHRDVKPANILLVDDPAGPRVKVADFGIARAASFDGADLTDLTQPGALLGTAKYLAPEQVEGKTPDARADIYALGVVLYEMLAGRPPFAADTAIATAMAHVHSEPLRLRQLRAGVPRPLEAVVTKAMAKDPDDRYQSAAMLRTALLDLDLREDDAVAMVERDPTPPAGLPASFRQAERPWLVPAALIVLISVLLVVAGVLFSRSEVGQELFNRPAEAPAAPDRVQIASTRSFDPEGNDREENENRVRLVRDGNPATGWATDTYRTREFGALKPGVGLVVELDGTANLGRLEVSSPTRGWSASVFVVDEPADRLADWGTPVKTMEGIEGDAGFDLGGTRGRAVLLWITRLGEGNRVEVTELTVQPPAG